MCEITDVSLHRPKPMDTCNHRQGWDSSVRTYCVNTGGELKWYATCTVCGRSTEMCATLAEAPERAERGWWANV